MKLTESILALDAFQLQADTRDWREAVKLGVDLLARAGSVEPRYFDAIVRMTGEIGPWYLLAPGLAMPNARPEEGVVKDGVALVTLKTPVTFGGSDNDPVDILVTLAATSAKTMNEDAIVQVATLFEDEDTVARLRAATTRAELEAVFAGV